MKLLERIKAEAENDDIAALRAVDAPEIMVWRAAFVGTDECLKFVVYAKEAQMRQLVTDIGCLKEGEAAVIVVGQIPEEYYDGLPDWRHDGT